MNGCWPIRSVARLTPQLADPDATLQQVEDNTVMERRITPMDSLFPILRFRFNLRKSNTEPVLRLNVETRADEQRSYSEKTEELLALIRA